VVDPYLEHWEAALKFNSSLFRTFLRLEFSFDPAVHFESVSGIWEFTGIGGLSQLKNPPVNPDSLQ
jgi:hypothetical protein